MHATLPCFASGLAAPPLGLEERLDLALLARDGDRAAEERLLRSCAGLVRALATRVARARGCDAEDLFLAGLGAAAAAIRRFDGSGRLGSYVFTSARGAILREADALSGAVSVPVHLKRALRAVNRDAAREVASGSVREAAIASAIERAVARERGRGRALNGNRLKEALRAVSRTVAPVADTGETHDGRTSLADPRSRCVFDAIDARLDAERALAALTARERAVLERRYGLDGAGEKSLREVGRALSLSQEGVRKIEATALERARAAVGERSGRRADGSWAA